MWGEGRGHVEACHWFLRRLRPRILAVERWDQPGLPALIYALIEVTLTHLLHSCMVHSDVLPITSQLMPTCDTSYACAVCMCLCS